MTQTFLLDDAGRLALIDMTIATLQASDDERAPGAIAEYQHQRALVVERMAAAGVAPLAVQSDGKPPAQVVGMQSLRLRAN